MGVWDFDSASGKVDWSHGMELIYGLPKGSFKGTEEDFVRRIHPDDVAHNLRAYQLALEAKRPFDFTFRIIRTDGEVRWINARGAARWGEDGNFLGASGIHLDISDQVQRERELRLQAQVIANMAEGVVIVDTESGNLVYANPRFEQMLGYSSGAIVGMHVSSINAGKDEEPQKVAKRIMEELRQRGAWRGEVKNRRADGQEIWSSCTVSEFEHEGQGKVWVGVHSDITEQRRAQLARDDALLQLRRLSLNIQDSIEAERLAVSRDVHDQLGAALTGIRMKLEALASSLSPESAALSGSLLEVARTARNTQLAARDICTRLRPQVLDDVGLVEACRWYLKDWSSKVGIMARSRLSRLKTEPDGRVSTDMFRAMQELLTNVAQHSAATQVTVSLSGGVSGLILKVSDNGHGFASNQLPKGFGLLGVRERVRQHAGQFELDSSESGTTVRLSMGYRTAP